MTIALFFRSLTGGITLCNLDVGYHARIERAINSLGNLIYLHTASLTARLVTCAPSPVTDLKGNMGDKLRATFINLADILDAYNNGYLGPGHCSE